MTKEKFEKKMEERGTPVETLPLFLEKWNDCPSAAGIVFDEDKWKVYAVDFLWKRDILFEGAKDDAYDFLFKFIKKHLPV